MTVKTLLINEYGDLFAGGTFHSRVWNGNEFISVFNVAHFHADKQVWAPLQGGQLVCNWAAASVLTLAWDPVERNLFLGGKFNYIDSEWIPAGLAVWNDETGLRKFPGGGLSMGNTTFDGVATALALDPDAGILIVAGNFNRVGDIVCDSIASWHLRHSYWTCLFEESHSFDIVTAMLFSSDALYVAGRASWRSSWASSETTFWNSTSGSLSGGAASSSSSPSSSSSSSASSPTSSSQSSAIARSSGDASSSLSSIEAENVYTVARFRVPADAASHSSGGSHTGSDSAAHAKPRSSGGSDLRASADWFWGAKAPPRSDDAQEVAVDARKAANGSAGSGPNGKAGSGAKDGGWSSRYRWEWLPAFGGTNGPIRSLLRGEDEWHGALLMGGEYTSLPSIVAYWPDGAGEDSDGNPIHLLTVGDPTAVVGAVTCMVQMRIRPQQGTQFVSREKSWRLVAIFASIGLGLGIVIAVALNFSAGAQLFRSLGMGTRGTSLAEMASYYSSYGKVDEGNMAEAYERAMQARHLWNKSNLPVLDPTEIVLESVIGEGSFGRVWRGTWRHSAVAVKEFVFAQAAVKGNSKQRDELLQEIVGEAGIMAMLRHPKILHLYGCSLTMQAIWITSELCSRGNLRQVLNDDDVHLDDETKLKMCCDVAEGMVYLHARDPPLIHRDLKTHNLFIHEPYPGDFVVKIGDWGSARAQASKSMRTMTHGVGTACWLAPEVIRHAKGSKASDVYSFGIVLWEIATRREVYPELGATQIIAKVANEGLRPPLPKRCPWSDLMQECWAEDADERPNFETILMRLTTLLCHTAQQASAKADEETGLITRTINNVMGYGT